MELIETNKIIYLNTHFAYWVQDNKVFRGKIKINKRRNAKKLRLIKNTTKELKEICTPDATLQKILKLLALYHKKKSVSIFQAQTL